MIVELQDRLCKPMPRLKAQYLLPSHIANLSTEVWQDIKNEYGSLLPQPSIVDVELEGWKHAIDSGAVKAESLQKAVCCTIHVSKHSYYREGTSDYASISSNCREVI